MHKLHGQKSYFQVFIFDLNSSRDLAFLCSNWRFAQRKGARNVTVSIPYFTVFLFSVKISWKFLILKIKTNSLLVMLYRLGFYTLQSGGVANFFDELWAHFFPFLFVVILYWTPSLDWKGPIKDGPSFCLSVLQSIRPSFCLSVSFLRIGSLVFSET